MTPSIYGILPVLLICGLASTATAAGLSTPTILADTNRDGVVNQLDAKNKDAWTDRRGAIFLPNIGDSTDRCASADLTGLPLSNDELWRCHDASGDNLLPESVQYTAPLWTLPMSGLSDDAVGHIYVESIRARDRVRIFWKAPNAFDETIWAIVDRQVSFNATSLRKGITLALDGRGLVTDAAVWDGSVRVVFEVTDRNRTTRDSVALRQAPVLLHHHLQPAEVVLSTAPGDTDARQAESAWQAHFVRGVTDAIAGDVPIVLFNQSTDMDIWAQDFLEPGYASMPGPNGRPVTIRILLRSAQSTRSAGRQVFSQLQGPGIGGFQPGPGSGFGFEEINSGGNLETIPPYTSRSGRHWPHGRIITGTHYGTPPAESMLTFLASQRSQTPPLFLETGWLAIGHVDEVVQLLPSNSTPCGFTLAIVDTRSAISLLQNLTSSGHGTTPFLTFPKSLAVPDYTTFFLDPTLFNTTPSSLLSSPEFHSTQSYAQQNIDATLSLLLRELPLRESDILRIPTLFRDVTYPWLVTPDGHPPRLRIAREGERQLKGMMPQAINGLVVNRGKYLAPRQWGPVIMDKEVEVEVDVFGEAVEREYRRVGMEVRWVDDWMTHHVRGGEVHCGTNALRGVKEGWWA